VLYPAHRRAAGLEFARHPELAALCCLALLAALLGRDLLARAKGLVVAVCVPGLHNVGALIIDAWLKVLALACTKRETTPVLPVSGLAMPPMSGLAVSLMSPLAALPVSGLAALTMGGLAMPTMSGFVALDILIALLRLLWLL